MDARGGESNSQHVLFRGDVVLGGDAVQIIHVAERETRWGRREKKILQRQKKKNLFLTLEDISTETYCLCLLCIRQ